PSAVGLLRGPLPQPPSYSSVSFLLGRATFHRGLPSLAPRHRAYSLRPCSSSSAAVMNRLSPTTAGLENPTPPRAAFQASGSPLPGHCLSSPVSGEWPSRFGPRHWGQSAAVRAVASRSVAAADRRAGIGVLGTDSTSGGRAGRARRRKYTRHDR